MGGAVRSTRVPRRDEYAKSYSTSFASRSSVSFGFILSTSFVSTSSVRFTDIYLSYSSSVRLSNHAAFFTSGTLYSVLDASRTQPMTFTQSPEGLLYMATGLGPVLVWDGFTQGLFSAGTAAPTTAPVLAGSGKGSIVGTYSAYVRFIDNLGNPSNLSPVSDDFTASQSTGTITNVTATAPIQITSAAHGLTTGTTVQVQDVLGIAAANTSTTVTVLDADTFALDATSGSGTYASGGTWTSGVSTVTYTAVPVPADTTNVRTKQILRNTAGQATVYYVDVETSDLLTTTFSSTRADSDLSAQTAVPIFDDAGNLYANRYGVPPADKAVIASHQGRMFLAVDVEYAEGSVAVTFGSSVVTGIGTEWNGSFVGRFLYVVGSDTAYEIFSVTNQTIVLVDGYLGPTNPYAVYSIRPAPGRRRLVNYSEADNVNAWPATNAFSLAEDGDEITGLMSKGSFLYVLERRHVYRETFQSSPADDGGIFLSAQRGCVNQRCWVNVEDKTFMLDEFGVHAFTGGDGGTPTSFLIMDLFRPSDAILHINWASSKTWHASHFPAQEVIRWFVTMDGDRQPHHALCYAYRHERWWVEEYPFAVTSSTVMLLDFSRTIVGAPGKRVFALWGGPLDVADESLGTVRGTATSGGVASLTDTSASFPTSRVANAPLCITAGTGKGQVRRIASVSGTTLNVTQPWSVRPDSTSVYQVGGVPWRWQSGWFRYALGVGETETRELEVMYEPRVADSPVPTFDLLIYQDWSRTPLTFGMSIGSGDNAGLAVVKGNSALTADLTRTNGFVHFVMDDHKGDRTDGPRFVSVGLEGFGGADSVVVFGVMVRGATQ